MRSFLFTTGQEQLEGSSVRATARMDRWSASHQSSEVSHTIAGKETLSILDPAEWVRQLHSQTRQIARADIVWVDEAKNQLSSDGVPHLPGALIEHLPSWWDIGMTHRSKSTV